MLVIQKYIKQKVKSSGFRDLEVKPCDSLVYACADFLETMSSRDETQV